jgi:manganese-dependent inorganic pyrophosphatase
VIAELGVCLSTPGDAESFVLVDASDVIGLPEIVDPKRVVEVIDHRLHHEAARLFPNATIRIEPVGAAATLIAELWRDSGRQPSAHAAQLLQAAILSNTQRLRGSVTTNRDRIAFGWLSGLVSLPEGMVDRQMSARTGEILGNLDAALVRESKTFTIAGEDLVISQLEIIDVHLHLDGVKTASRVLGGRAMVNVVDVVTACSALVVDDPAFRRWVGSRLSVEFSGAVAYFEPAVLRKQLVIGLMRGVI